MTNIWPQKHDQDSLDEYLQICHEIYLDMVKTGSWPWPEDSQNSGKMVDSDDV